MPVNMRVAIIKMNMQEGFNLLIFKEIICGVLMRISSFIVTIDQSLFLGIFG